MAETCFISTSLVPNFTPRSNETSPSFSAFSFTSLHNYSFLRPPSSHSLRLTPTRASNSVNFPGHDDDQYGLYPWESPSGDGDRAIEWVPEDRVTLFTSDGMIQIGGSLVPRRTTMSEKKQIKLRADKKYQRFQEKDYMDPEQSLCLGALFDIAATNGLDMSRKLCIIGFCRSIEMLSDVVEDTVLEHGGEIVVAEKASKAGLNEKLTMTVAVPLLWGIPPASETLHLAVRSGGGIVEKVFWRWDFL